MFMKVQVSSTSMKRKFDMKDSRIRTHDPDGPVYWPTLTTRPLRIYIASTPNEKQGPNQFQNSV